MIWLLKFSPLKKAEANQCHHDCHQYSPIPSVSPRPSPTVNPCSQIDLWEVKQDNLDHPCVSPTPEAGASATPDPTPVSYDHAGEGDGLGCATHDCSGNKIGSPNGFSYRDGPPSPYSPYDGSLVGAK